jgi:hypothetical protein
MAQRDNARGQGNVGREDFEVAIRHVADVSMRSAHRAARIEALLRSVVRAMVESRVLDLEAFERNLAAPTPTPTPTPAPRSPGRPAISLGQPVDKYAVRTPPDLDCAALLPICGARCCMLTFPLAPQDLDEGQVAWSYGQPYEIARAADHRCVHQDRATGGCTVYGHRPAVCRTYDCRQDPRVWEDFERRIPAPRDAVLPKRGL